MLTRKFTREEYASRKEQRKKIYAIIFEFVNLNDDYWIPFKKLRKVLKRVEDAQIFFAPFVGKDGMFIASKLEEFNQLLDAQYEIIMAKQKILEEKFAQITAAKKAARESNQSKTKIKVKNKKTGRKTPNVKVIRPNISKFSPLSKPNTFTQEAPKVTNTFDEEDGQRKRIRRVRLTDEQRKVLEQLRKEKENNN
ncbi:MAG: hypothetical protein LBR28_06320 [Bacteroidales bacterium]|jgi:hypothetical protein|nr:hypothetical protein [Bacteroidales bacterium]